MSLSILIVNWNSLRYLRRCLQSVRTHCPDVAAQIIVVDGGSFDGCGEMLSSEFPEVVFVQIRDNVGFGRSNNIGFERVTGDFLLLLNPDTELEADAVQSLLIQLKALPQAGVVAPRLLNADGSLQTSCVQALPTPLNQVLNFELLRRWFPMWSIWGNHRAFVAQQPVEVEAVSGACMLLRSETFRGLRGFSPQFFMYGEDMDLCARIRKAGLKIYHIPSARVIHCGGGSTTGEFSKLSVILLRQAIFLFISSHQGSRAAAMYRVLMTVSSTLRVLVLAPPWVWSRFSKPRQRQVPLRKWLAVLRWSIGLERWAVRNV